MITRPLARKRCIAFSDDAEARIRFVTRHARIGASNLNPTAATHAHKNHIMQPDRLVHSQQFVKPIGPRRANAQPEIDLRKRPNRDSHGWMIVSHRKGRNIAVPYSPGNPIISAVCKKNKLLLSSADLDAVVKLPAKPLLL